MDLVDAALDVAPALIRDQLAYYVSQGANTVYVLVGETELVNDARLKATIDSAHDLGLVVVLDPYIGGVFHGDRGGSAAGILAGNPRWTAVSRHGVAANVAAVNSAAFRDSVLSTLDRFLAYDLDGVVLDQPGFPMQPLAESGDYFPFDDDAQLQFESRFGHVLPQRETNEVVQFRRDSMKSFLEELMIETHNKRSDVSTRLVVGPDSGNDPRSGADDWRDLASMQQLDALQTALPAGPDEASFAVFVRNETKLVDAVSEKQRSGMWIETTALGDGSYSFISREIDDARRHGVTQLVAAVDVPRANAQPDLVWVEIRKGFGVPDGQGGGAQPPLLSSTTAVTTSTATTIPRAPNQRRS